MNEGARQANEARRHSAEQYDREAMVKRLDRIIALLERIEANTRPFVSVPYVQTEIPCTCGQTPVCRRHSPTMVITTGSTGP